MHSAGSKPRRSGGKRLKNRRGFTLILTVLMMAVMIGAAAFAVDFSRMTLFRAQLQTATDGAALSAAIRIRDGDLSNPNAIIDTATNYGNRHPVENTTVTVNPGNVILGNWTPGGGFVTPATDTTAVRVSASYNANYGFGRFFGLTSHTVNAVSEAAVGHVGATTCIRPVAVPYQALLDQIYPPAGTKDAASYNLTESDIDLLKAATSASAALLKAGDAADSPTSGSFYLMQMGPYMYSNGTIASPGPDWGGGGLNGGFPLRFGGNCSNSPWTVGPGDWLMGKQGNASGPTQSGFEQLCGITISGNGDFTCPAPIENRSIKVAMWSVADAGVCSPRCFKVKYVGVWVVTAYRKSPSTGDGIFGYFSAMPSDGSFTTVPGPLEKIALVR
jgi:Flp pilus assembly protein TadG